MLYSSTEAMKRSPGITFAAVIALIGSIVTLLFGLLMLVIMMFAPIPTSGQSPVSPTFMRAIFVLLSLFYLLPAIWGIVSSVGLFRLRNWARISIIVFSILLLLTGVFAGLVSLLMPAPAGVDTTSNPSIMLAIRLSMGLFWLTMMGIGVWWLVFFTRASVKTHFGVAPAGAMALPPLANPEMPPPIVVQTGPRRPLSITIIAWLLLIGCALLPVSLLLRAPMVLFTTLITGWAAAAFCVGYAIANFFVGRGLLRLQPWARKAAIGLFGFGLLNTAVFYFAPGGRVRMLALMENQRSMFGWETILPNQPQVNIDLGPLFPVFSVLGLIGAAIPIYFLITRKTAFRTEQH
jgi:hypothetical protein